MNAINKKYNIILPNEFGRKYTIRYKQYMYSDIEGQDGILNYELQDFGCGPCSMATILSSIGYDLDPVSVAKLILLDDYGNKIDFYTNGKKLSINRNYFGEFLSIYFEFYAIDYLLKKGISKEEIDYLRRIKNAEQHSTLFYQYEIILLAYTKFGNLDDNTVTLLQEYFFNMKREVFEEECTTLYKILCIVEEKNKDRIKENPNELGCALANEFMAYNYKYILGTFLAVYAHKYSDFNDIVNLNNHINEFNDKTVYDICSDIGIDLNDENFFQKLFNSMDEYIYTKQMDPKKGI